MSLKGTTYKGLVHADTNLELHADTNLELHEYVDVDTAGEINNRKSTTGYVYRLGGTAVNWISKLQRMAVLSTTSMLLESGKKMIWLQYFFLQELDVKCEEGTLHSDN